MEVELASCFFPPLNLHVYITLYSLSIRTIFRVTQAVVRQTGVTNEQTGPFTQHMIHASVV